MSRRAASVGLVLACALVAACRESGAGGPGGGGEGGEAVSTAIQTTSASVSSGGDPADVDALLVRLRTDRDATILAQGNGDGFPARVAEGCVVVSTDPAATDVAGDHDGWAGTPLIPDAGFAWALLPCNPGAQYKLVAEGVFFADPIARAYTYDSFGQMSFVVAPDGVAHRERFLAVGAGAIAPRTVRVWVPAEPPTHVVFAADGQNLFEPDAPFGGWRLDASAPPGMLLVGVDNSPARFDEYTHVADDVGTGGEVGGAAEAYVAFLHDEVEPLVASRYGSVDKRGLLGSSLGGLVSLVAADTYPGHYRVAMSMSGTVGWGSIGLHNETILERMARHGHQGTAIYLDSGGGGPCLDADGDGLDDDGPSATDNYCENAQLRDVLAGLGYAFDVDLFHWHAPGATHDEAAWAARVARPLGIFASM